MRFMPDARRRQLAPRIRALPAAELESTLRLLSGG